jgi:hypothetical protein
MLNKNFSPLVTYLTQAVTELIAFGPITHEEGHSSILVEKNIGSIVQPFILSVRGGYVDGVTDQTLENLRNSDFPDFIRLYTAGLESDYMLSHHEESLMAFEDEPYNNIMIEYLFRKVMIIQYYLQGFIKYNTDGNEETNELKRDIVGNDVYGAIRQLYRPTMPFYRYTRYNDLTPEEKEDVRKMGFRAFFNLVNMNIIGKSNFIVSDNLKMNFGMGHTLCPFGDFTDENFWVKYKDYLKINAYLREFENRSNWFLAGGIGISDFPLAKRLTSSVNVHLWNQPVDLSFDENTGKLGGAVEIVNRYNILASRKTKLKNVSIDLGLIYKTYGFLPEEVYLNKHFGISLGMSFFLEGI